MPPPPPGLAAALAPASPSESLTDAAARAVACVRGGQADGGRGGDLAACAWLVSCLATGSPAWLSPGARLVAMATLYALSGGVGTAALVALVDPPAATPECEGVVASLLEGNRDTAAAALAASVEVALAWGEGSRVRAPRSAVPAPAALPAPFLDVPAYVPPPTRDEMWWFVGGGAGDAAPGRPAGGSRRAPADRPLAHLLRRAAAGVLPPVDGTLAGRLVRERGAGEAVAAVAPLARGVADAMPALAAAAACAVAAECPESPEAAFWTAALSASPLTLAWASAVADAAAADPPLPPSCVRDCLVAAMRAAESADDGGRAARLAAGLARALRRSSARAALAPLQPELEAFSLSFSRYREAADLYRELKSGEKEGGG
jgi:hypothetical protein